MSSKAYLVHAEDMTFSEKSDYRLNVMAAGIQRAISQGVGEWNKKEFPNTDPDKPSQPLLSDIKNFLSARRTPQSIDIRDFQPILDAGAVLDQWNTPALAVAGAEYSCFQAIAAPAIALRNKKLVVWYRVQSLTVPLPVCRLLFRRTNATGTLMYSFDMEQLATAQRLDGFFSEPVIWDSNQPYAINVMAKGMPAVATGLISEIVLSGLVFEVSGTVHV